MEQLENLDITTRELQSLMFHYGYYYAGQVDLAADEIYTETTDPQIRRSVIQWSTLCVPEMMMYCFNQEPMVAMISAWTYAILIRSFFETGNGKDLFGPHHEQVVGVSRELEEEIRSLARDVLSPADAETASVRISTWAAAHPIRNEQYVTEGYSTSLTAAVGAGGAGGLAAAGSISEQLMAMSDRLNLMMGHMPHQIRWEAAAVLSMGQDVAAEIADSTLVAIHEGAMEVLPALLAFLSRERELFTEDLSRERAAVLEAISGERSAILQEIARERGQVFKEIARERNEAMGDISALTLDALHVMVLESREAAQASIDQGFQRILQLLALPFLGLIALVIVAMIWVRNTTNRILALWARSQADREA
jgi:hypothetical protein